MLVPHLLMQADYPRHEGRVKSVILPYRGYWYVRHLYHGRDELHRVCTRRDDMEGGAEVTTSASLPWPREERQSCGQLRCHEGITAADVGAEVL